jgi:CheY-like chemotaxis protein
MNRSVAVVARAFGFRKVGKLANHCLKLRNHLVKGGILEASAKCSALIVDDEMYARRLIQFMLQKHGVECHQAESGDQALALIAEGLRPDLILLDIMMPGRSGLETLAEIRKHADLQNVPVVLLTGVVHEDVIRQAAKLGATDYIRKPFHPGELAERVRKLLPR